MAGIYRLVDGKINKHTKAAQVVGGATNTAVEVQEVKIIDFVERAR